MKRVGLLVKNEKMIILDLLQAMLHGHDNVEMDTTRGHVTNS